MFLNKTHALSNVMLINLIVRKLNNLNNKTMQ